MKPAMPGASDEDAKEGEQPGDRHWWLVMSSSSCGRGWEVIPPQKLRPWRRLPPAPWPPERCMGISRRTRMMLASSSRWEEDAGRWKGVVW